MNITPFAVEEWMNAHETRCRYNLAETCVHSLTVQELLTLAGRNEASLSELLPMRMTYGDIEGSARLRTAIAGLYAHVSPENIVGTHGTIGANALVYHAMVAAGDKVISVVPTYQQHVSIPASIGAEVLELPLRAEDGYALDLDALSALTEGGARLITLCNPNNPTGALIGADALADIAAIAERAGAWVLCDEVYRGTDQQGTGMTASMADVYERGISTGSVSKAFSLAGLRLGWIAAPREVLDKAMVHRDYTTISVGMIDDHLASLALENCARILERSRRITRGNLAVLADWVAREPRVSWVRPESGTTALLQIADMGASAPFCRALLDETGVLFTPGSALGAEGTVRIGFANAPDVLKQGLPRVSAFLAKGSSGPG